MPSAEVTTLDAVVANAVAPRKLITSILGSFSSLALLLAAIGIYGVIAYSVSQRAREISIRLAVGATRRNILRQIIGEGLQVVGLGILIGLVGAYFLSRFLTSLLYDVNATDPLMFAVSAIIILAVALFALVIPAGRAANVDPVRALQTN